MSQNKEKEGGKTWLEDKKPFSKPIDQVLTDIYQCERHGNMTYGSMQFWNCRRDHPLLLRKMIR